MVLGTTITADSQFPVYILAKEINVGVVFTRLEFIVAGVWITTLLAKSIFYFYAGTISLSGLLGLKDHKNIVMPIGLIVLVLSGVVFPDVIYQADWDTYVWPPFSMTYGILLPVLMLVVFYVKKAFSSKGRGE
jgi:spore germination protein KB